jgi:hypothetical protein
MQTIVLGNSVSDQIFNFKVIECADRKWNRASRKMFDAHEKV